MAINDKRKDPYDPYESDPNKTTLFSDRNPMAEKGHDIEEIENGTPRDEDDEGDFGYFSSEDSLRKVKKEQKDFEEKDGLESLTESQKSELLSILEDQKKQGLDEGFERSLFEDPEDRAPFV